MRHTSKDLLELETQKPSFIESSFLVCNEDPAFRSNDRQPTKQSSMLLTTCVASSQVLGKVKDFLGVIAEANKELELDVKGGFHDKYDIEVLTGIEKEYIEMDLVLGVADLQTPEAVAAAESAVAGSGPPNHYSSPNSSESDTETDGHEDDIGTTDEKGGLLNSTVEQRKKRPKIIEVP